MGGGDASGRRLVRTRDEFAAATAEFQRRMNGRTDKIGGVALIASLGLAWALMAVGDSRGWPRYLQIWFFIFGWTLGLVPMAIFRKRQGRVLRELRLLCNTCGKPLVDTVRMRGRAQAVLALGVCPSCAQPVFDDAPAKF
jgi:hypothetical protein